MRRKFAQRYGFVVPDIRLTESLTVQPKHYQIKIHGTVSPPRRCASPSCWW